MTEIILSGKEWKVTITLDKDCPKEIKKLLYEMAAKLIDMQYLPLIDMQYLPPNNNENE